MESEIKKFPIDEYADFVDQFRLAVKQGISESCLQQFRRDFWNLLIPISQGDPFPLERLRSEKFYTASIDSLIKSEDSSQRILAYITVASAGDKSFNKILRIASRREEKSEAKAAATMARLSLNDSDTFGLFDLITGDEELWEAHFQVYYLQLNKASLLKTAFKKLFSISSNAKQLALFSLSLGGLTSKADRAIREAVQSSDPAVKESALYAMKRLRMGNLRELLRPLLSCPDYTQRGLAFAALANSPSVGDRNFLESLTEPGNISEEVLNAYLESDDVENVRHWLVLVRRKVVPLEYFFSTPLNPLLLQEALVEDVRTTVCTTLNRHIIPELLKALNGRIDSLTVDLLISLLFDSEYRIRSSAADALKNNSAAKLVEQLPGLIRNKNLRTNALTDCAIFNKLDNLQDVYAEFFQPGINADIACARNASKYLSVFPRQKDIPLLKSLLEREDEDVQVKRAAAQGLAELRDESSIDLLIDAIRKTKHDSHATEYLKALGQIKGDKAKEVLKTFETSRVSDVRKLVQELLCKW